MDDRRNPAGGGTGRAPAGRASRPGLKQKLEHKVVVILVKWARGLSAAGMLVLAWACGGRSLDEEFRRHPARVLPQGASQVLYARVDRLRENPLAVLGFEQIGAIEWGRSMKGIAQTLRLAGTVDRMVVGTYTTEEEEPVSAVLVGIGKFDEPSFVRGLESGKIPHVAGKAGGTDMYTCGRGNERCFVSFPESGLLVAASRELLLNQVLGLTAGKAKSLAREKGFEALLKSYSVDQEVWATGLFPMNLAAPLAVDPRFRAIQYIHAFTLTLAGEETKRLRMTLHCETPQATQQNAHLLKDVVGLVNQARMAGYRIDALLAAVKRSKIAVAGPNAEFTFEMTGEEIAATAEAIKAGPVDKPSLLDQLGPVPGMPMPGAGPPRSP